MAKIGIFIGREHHGQKLMNIGAALAHKGHDVFPITANNAINIDPPQMNIGGYVHLYHYLTDVMVARASVLTKELHISSDVSMFWNIYSLREQLLVFFAFKSYLQSEDAPDTVLILHENNFWTKPIAYLCKQRGIPCFAFQEGLLRKKDQDDMKKQSLACEYSTKLFVWGNDSREQYIKAGVPVEKIIVSGASHLALAGDRKSNKRKLVTYFLPLLQHYYGSPEKDITAVSDYCRTNGFDFVVRPHPFENHLDLPFVTNKDKDVIPLILKTDIALCQHSTTALECLALKTPIIEMGLGNKNFLEPLAKEQPVIPSISTIVELNKIATTKNYTDSIWQWISDKIYLPAITQSVINTIVNEIESNL